MRHHWTVWAVIMIIAKAKSEFDSLEDRMPYTFSFANPSALNFHDIYTNTATAIDEEKRDLDDEGFTSTTTEEIPLSVPTHQYVEFHREPTTEPPRIPPPHYILKSTFLKDAPITKPGQTTTTTEDPDDVIRVVPIKRNYERGVLDLLFPESRVKTFKYVFNTIKRILSHTFRR